MVKIIIAVFLTFLADAHSIRTIFEDIEEYRIELFKNVSMPSYTTDSLLKLEKEDSCALYIPLVPDVRGLETVSEIKCKKYMWDLKNQLLEEDQRERCEVQKTLATYIPEQLYDGNTPEKFVGYGREAQYAEFPHMGAVGWRCKDTAKEWVFKCGSSLISDKFLLTAAHCTKLSPRFVSDIVNGDPEVVKLGVENILDDVGNEGRQPKIAKIVNIIVHPEYKSPKKYNDIALLEVDQAIAFTEFIKPACIWPHKDMSLVGKKVTLTGWGETETGQPATILQAGDVEILDTHTCDNILKPFHNRNWHGFTDNQMCAGKPGGRVDTCKGDSGGPLSIRLEGYDYISLHLVVGVTSFGIQCSVRDRPGVYTRVASYVNWIEKHVWNYTSKFPYVWHVVVVQYNYSVCNWFLMLVVVSIMINIHILALILTYIIDAGHFVCNAETSKRTIFDDLEEEREKQENIINVLFEDYGKNEDNDPCEPFTPLEPDVSKLTTLSEAKCKEYVWRLKSQQQRNIKAWHCHMQELFQNPQNNTMEIKNGYLAELPIIYGGHDVEIAQFPHMGAVGWRCKDTAKEWVFKCGGSLISDKFLLTAAHCTKLSPRFVSDIVNGDPEVVMLGVENISNTVGKKTRRPTIVKIKNIIVHPGYKAPKKFDDIALLEVDTPIEFTPFIMPACVWPHADQLPSSTSEISITGWGTTESGKPSSILQAADVEFLDTIICDALLRPFYNRHWNGFTDKQMCAGNLDGGIDTCQGDSGGPLQVRLNSGQIDSAIHMVVGITSFGFKCGVRNQPGVYTRVASYIDWIEEHVWNGTITH
ncbi:uncharacterized protein LOC121734431 [Aricia agestis]|uniref:uncharacterized protein LOC121734431 n=1 Tax=Aricia agestis TaxID=91739 RepID=UPI001C2068B4|nr:uncharacterized protein LOC121734431 [Aricia agestis]